VTELYVNGSNRSTDVDARRTLLSTLRDELGLTGAKYACGEAQCGACLVLVDGQPLPACVTRAGDVVGKQLRTIEGIADGVALHPLQQTFLDAGALQCGYCTPGMLVASLALLSRIAEPSDDQIKQALQNNICRCGTYGRIIHAIKQAAVAMKHNQRPSPPRDEVMPHVHKESSNNQPDDVRAVPDSGCIGAWLHIAEDGTVTVFTGKVEVGQQIRASLAQAVADELCVPPTAIRMVMADTATTPFDMGTFGSQTTPRMALLLRRAAVAARERLLDLASEQLGSRRDNLRAEQGRIIDVTTGSALQYGDITRGAHMLDPIAGDADVAQADAWTVAGTSLANANRIGMVTGAHRYTPDVQRPGLRFAKVVRPPTFNATCVSFDAPKAQGMPDVTIDHEGDFIGVVAPTEQIAETAAAAIDAEWHASQQPSSIELFTYLKTHPASPEGHPRSLSPSLHEAGSVQDGIAAADHVVESTYTNAYIAHAPLEPRAAVAEWRGEMLTVWTGTQRPFGVRTQLASAFSIPEENVRVVVPDTGSGYGGKHQGDAAIEAARLAKAAGTPVKLVWSREEEFTWAYFRPAGVIDIRAGVRDDGRLTAWECDTYNCGNNAMRTPYEVPHQRVAFHAVDAPLRQGSYRALAATANHFARESCMDELAHAIGMDTLEFRLRNLREPRLRAVLEAAADTASFTAAKRSDGRGFGLACGTEKGSFVATVAEVVVEGAPWHIRAVRVIQAFECGAIVNPDNLRNQIEGAIVQGLGGALFESIEFDSGKILNPRFSRYRVPRFADVPDIDVVLLDRKDLPSAGGGETPIVGIAPAIANAVFSATGMRLRSMPLLGPGVT
jgi:isoquinoline 1-oxidoreductase